ncbi:hypothetical protein BSNK01_07710 [Bacillaceae bacterium]
MNGHKEPTVSALLRRLHELRQSVPVNEKLKQDLRKELEKRIERMDPEKKRALLGPSPQQNRRSLNRLIAISLAVLLIGFLFFRVFGGPVEVREIASGHSVSSAAALSPDGERIAVIGEGELKIFDFEDQDGEELRYRFRLPRNDSSWDYLTWSPDSQMLAVTSVAGEKGRVWLIRPGHRTSRLLVEEEASRFGQIAWSPDLRWLLVTRTAGDTTELVRIDTTNSALLPWGKGAAPAWSSDGKYIAFEREGQIWLSHADGSGEKRIGRGHAPFWTGKAVLNYIAGDPLRLVYSERDLTGVEDNVAWKNIELPFAAADGTERVSSSRDGTRLIWVERNGQGGVSVYRGELKR